jgi:hypothetical protein
VLAQCDLHRRHDRRDSVAGAAMNDLIKVDATNATAIQTPLAPNKADISSHLYALFDPAFVQAHPDAWIEIAYGRPDGKLNAAGNFTAFSWKKRSNSRSRRMPPDITSMSAHRYATAISRIVAGPTAITLSPRHMHGPNTMALAMMSAFRPS